MIQISVETVEKEMRPDKGPHLHGECTIRG